MNDTTPNITRVETNKPGETAIIEIATGGVLTARFVRWVNTHTDERGCITPATARFWTKKEVTTAGVPDKRCRGTRLGVYDHRGSLAGCYATENPEREALALEKRATIAEIRAKLAAAEQDLLNLYR
jgi:hypothetical protein